MWGSKFSLCENEKFICQFWTVSKLASSCWNLSSILRLLLCTLTPLVFVLHPLFGPNNAPNSTVCRFTIQWHARNQNICKNSETCLNTDAKMTNTKRNNMSKEVKSEIYQLSQNCPLLILKQTRKKKPKMVWRRNSYPKNQTNNAI